jgi:fatty acid hydroxylase family protein
MGVAAESADRRPARYGREVKTLAHARSEFAHKRSPWMIVAAIAIAAIWRATLGPPGWQDVVAVAASLVIYPFGEWAIHVYLLHMKPIKIRGRRIDPPAARSHRAHHGEPTDLSMILLEPKEVAQLLLLAVPVSVAIIGLVFWLVAGSVPLAPLLTAAITDYALILCYEWTHFLIHTAYRPRSRFYKSAWRNHRLHHFKNEHFWHGVTNNVSDRVLGTNPEQSTVRRSRTARTLDPGSAV